MPFSYLFMFSQIRKVQGAHRCHSRKKITKKNKKNKVNIPKNSLASGLLLQSQQSVDTAFTTNSLYPPDHFFLWEFIPL